MGEITRLLELAAQDAEGALDEVFQRLHGELKALAASRLRRSHGLTLSPTGLVNELYLKFTGAGQLDLQSRQHFFACAAAAMRQIVVDAARAEGARKRGGDQVFVTLTDPGEPSDTVEILALDRAMQDLETWDKDLSRLVELRFFAGLTLEQIAEVTRRSPRSLKRDWTRARAFPHAQLAS